MQVGAKRDKGMKGILIMEKITIKNFIDEYNKRGTTTMKDEYIRD